MSFYDTYDDLTQLNEWGFGYSRPYADSEKYTASQEFWNGLKQYPQVLFVGSFHRGFDKDIDKYDPQLRQQLFDDDGVMRDKDVKPLIDAIPDVSDEEAAQDRAKKNQKFLKKALGAFYDLQFNRPNARINNDIMQRRAEEARKEKERQEEEARIEKERQESEAYQAAKRELQKEFKDKLQKNLNDTLRQKAAEAMFKYLEMTGRNTEDAPNPFIMPHMGPITNGRSWVSIVYYDDGKRWETSEKSINIELGPLPVDMDAAKAKIDEAIEKINSFYRWQLNDYRSELYDMQEQDRAAAIYPWAKEFLKWARKGGDSGTFVFQPDNGPSIEIPYKQDPSAFLQELEDKNIPPSAMPVLYITSSSSADPGYSRGYARANHYRTYYISMSNDATEATLAKHHIEPDGQPMERGVMTSVSMYGDRKGPEQAPGGTDFYLDGMDRWMTHKVTYYGTD